MRKFLDGFYWGLGFAIALVSVFATYAVVGHIAIERNYQKSMDELLSEKDPARVDSISVFMINGAEDKLYS